MADAKKVALGVVAVGGAAALALTLAKMVGAFPPEEIPPAAQYTLTVNAQADTTSAAVDLTVDSQAVRTPGSLTLNEGTYTVTVPGSITVAGVTYNYSSYGVG